MKAFVVLAVAVRHASSYLVPCSENDWQQYKEWNNPLPARQSSAWSSWAEAHGSQLSAAQLAIEHFAEAETTYSVPARITETLP
ncbi:hypothetical protein BU25DRAFT_495776 [Macroventuria anomochaeta]|uniref:Uncharacterized protein n=1 Tax=Macroventuria anomochaeta TaxID=301207 RepID=A0ACB6RIF5_9PLEO|nr:uncharacterized protein BU25DRAFT_495776 [Macroventuria anomochaeta]KAF2621467.1 hypothetical protein BU25DRAFT_495776 [Macroventuria anomochaeta]